jgi:hypothetical protein
MKIHTNRNGSDRLLRSRTRAFAGAGVASVLAIASLAVVGVLPAAATTGSASAISISTATTNIVLNEAFTVDVNLTGGTSGDDVITITTSAGCTLGGTDSATFGSANPMVFNDVTFTAGTSCTLSAADNNSVDTTSPTGTITVAPSTTASKLAFKTAPPSTTAASTALTTFTVATEDQYGNVVTSGTGSTDIIAITSSCTTGGTDSAQETAGIATFSAVTLNTVGGCQLVASDTTAPDTSFTVLNQAITVTAGVPTKVVFTTAPPATDLTIGSALTSFAVSVEDVNGHVETTGTGATDSIVITASGCTLGGTTTELAVAGVATFPAVTVTTAGTCVLTATDATRTVTAATATTIVGEAQAALTVSTTTGYLDAPLTLATAGGSGTGAVTFSVTNGTATLCTITNGALTVKTAGTCLITATKAAASPYAGVSSAATTVTISAAPKALKVAGTIVNGRKATVTVTGYNFSGRPKVISNVAGFTGLVTRDSGRSLTITVTVKGKSAPGVKVMTIILASGARTSVKYSLHG